MKSFTSEEIVLTDSVDYRSAPVLAVSRHIGETDWGLVVKIDKSEAFALLTPLTKMRNLLAIILVASDETGVLGLSFNVMTANLMHAKNALNDKIQELIKEITERRWVEEALHESERLILSGLEQRNYC